MFNPAAMLPGAAHPKLNKAVDKEDSVDFDEPPEAETLSSAAKVRPNLTYQSFRFSCGIRFRKQMYT